MKDYKIRVLKIIEGGSNTARDIGATIGRDSRSTGGLLSRLIGDGSLMVNDRFNDPRRYRITAKGSNSIRYNDKMAAKEK